MSSAPHKGSDEGELRSDLVDLTGLDWDRFTGVPDSVLDASLQRILRENSASVDHFAAFQNHI